MTAQGIAPFDVRLPEADEADNEINSVVQPDLLVVCDTAKLDDKGCRGAPDWVVEVLSPHTATKDHIKKRALYERHGVREYWLVHPLDRLVTRYEWRNGRFQEALAIPLRGGFQEPSIDAAAGAMAVSCLPGLVIDWRFFEPWHEALSGPDGQG